jgi:hypothetical protein
MILTLVLGVVGIVMQVKASQSYTVVEYNRWE